MSRSLVSFFSALVFSASALVGSAPAVSAQTRASSQAVVASRIVEPVDDSVRVTLHGYVHPLANAANDRGPAPDSMALSRMHLVLHRSATQEADLRQYIEQTHTPGSPSYHKWLTPAEFGQRFGPSDQDVATVESWLSSQGFAVSGVLPGKQAIEFSGNVAQMRQAFAVQVHHYELNGNPRFATATEPQIPAALAPVVSGFVSLNNFHPKSYARLLGRADYDPKTGKATPTWTVPGGAGYPTIGGVNFALSPADFAVQYDLTPLYNAGVNGTGQTIAIVNESNINIALVNQFRSLFSLPANPPNVIIDGNDPGIDGINNPDGPNGASAEAYLDVEWAGAVAPDATVDLVIGGDTALESGLILAAEHAVYGDVAPVMSMSFGQCEATLGSSNAFINQNLMEQAAAEGITVMVSTGDNGSAGCDDPNSQYYAVRGLGVNGFASTPWNVAVGGTDFYYSNYASLTLTNLATYWNTTGTNAPSASLLGTIPEQPWNSSQFGLDASNFFNNYGYTTIAGGSGGASSAAICSAGYNSSTGACKGATTGYPKPSWQTSTGVPSDGVRDIPDVSLFAADGPNYSYYPICYEDGDCQPNSSGPVQIFGVGGTSAAAPAFAGIMALVNQKYGRQGQADFVLYPLKTQFPAAFHDVTVGTNTVPCNLSTVSASGQTFSPVNCISVANPITVSDPTFGSSAEGELGSGSTASYNAGAGYNLATGLGSVDANVLVNDWGNVENSFGKATVTLSATPTSLTHGQSISISGTVTGSGTPTGYVALMTNSTLPGMSGLGDFALSSGSFSGSSVNYLPGGTYDIWGQYSGDGTNGPSQSTPVQVTVSPEASTTAMTLLNSSGAIAVSSGSTSVPYGAQIELNAVVHGASGSGTCVPAGSTGASHYAYGCPTGAITFSDSSNAINTAILNSEGDAEYNAPFAVGSHSVTATYAGDGSYQASSASPVTFTVVKNTPVVFFSASNYQSTSSTGTFVFAGGQDTYFDILIENSANLNSQTGATTTGGPMPAPVAAPTGSVTVTGLPGGGSQTINLVAGVDPATGQAVGLAVVKIPASASAELDLQHQPNPWLPGGGAAVFACVVLLAIPARRRAWRSFLCMVVFAGLVAAGISCGGGGGGNIGGGGFGGGGGGTGGSGSGNYTLGITYAGDGNYAALTGSGATSIPITITAPTLQTTTITASSSGSISPTTSMTVTGTVTGQSGHPAPTGVVYVIPSGEALTNQFFLTPGSGDSSNFTGTITSQSLEQGANFVTLQYSGDKNYNGSAIVLNNGNSINSPLSDFSITAVPSFSFAPTTGSTSIFVNPANGFTGAVALTCSAPTGITCSLGTGPNTTVSLPASGASPSQTVTLSVTAATAGTYPITVTGSASNGQQVHTFGVSAIVQ